MSEKYIKEESKDRKKDDTKLVFLLFKATKVKTI